jgi:hypothetical protein
MIEQHTEGWQRVGRSKNQQNVLGACETRSWEVAQRYVAGSSDEVGVADRSGADVYISWPGVWVA